MPRTTLLRRVKAEVEAGGVFEPEDIAVMTTAFDNLLADLELTNRDDPGVTILAKLVIEVVRKGERDPDRVRRVVAARLGIRDLNRKSSIAARSSASTMIAAVRSVRL